MRCLKPLPPPHLRCPKQTSLVDDRAAHSTVQCPKIITADQPEPGPEMKSVLGLLIQSIWKRNAAHWQISQSHLEAKRSASQSPRFYSMPSHLDTRPHDLGPHLQWVGKSFLEKNEPPTEQPPTCESMTRKKNTSWEVRVLSVKGAETTANPQCCQHDPLIETLGSTVCVCPPPTLYVHHRAFYGSPLRCRSVCAWSVLHEKKLEGNSEANAPWAPGTNES